MEPQWNWFIFKWNCIKLYKKKNTAAVSRRTCPRHGFSHKRYESINNFTWYGVTWNWHRQPHKTPGLQHRPINSHGGTMEFQIFLKIPKFTGFVLAMSVWWPCLLAAAFNLCDLSILSHIAKASCGISGLMSKEDGFFGVWVTVNAMFSAIKGAISWLNKRELVNLLEGSAPWSVGL